MNNKLNNNKGFTLIELLISMALLSIVMLMVVQFMSSTAAANRKTKANLEVQSEAQEVIQNISDTLTTANYVRVVKSDGKAYDVSAATSLETDKRDGTMETALSFTTDKGSSLDFDFVPDNYGNYVKKSTDPERKVILDLDTYQLVGEAKDTVYPLADDTETATDVRSFRVLKQGDKYYYIKPTYIYAEYEESGKITTTIYRFDVLASSGDNNYDIYMYRNTVESTETNRFSKAKAAVDALSGEKGRLTENIQDFYLSADAEGNALLINSVFYVNGYRYNAIENVKFRNSNVLTVRPQNLYKKSGTGVTTP